MIIIIIKMIRFIIYSNENGNENGYENNDQNNNNNSKNEIIRKYTALCVKLPTKNGYVRKLLYVSYMMKSSSLLVV